MGVLGCRVFMSGSLGLITRLIRWVQKRSALQCGEEDASIFGFRGSGKESWDWAFWVIRNKLNPPTTLVRGLCA